MPVLCIISIILMFISMIMLCQEAQESFQTGREKSGGEDTWIYGREILKEVNLLLFSLKAELKKKGQRGCVGNG